MKELVVAAMVVTLGACSKSDDVRDSVAKPKAAAATKSSATLEAGLASELPNSVEPGDSPLGGGIKH